MLPIFAARHSMAMTTIQNPRTAAAEVARTPVLPTGPDETVTGFGVMGLPFASGHYLALRDFPAASFLPDSVPGYRSVWHRDPAGADDGGQPGRHVAHRRQPPPVLRGSEVQRAHLGGDLVVG